MKSKPIIAKNTAKSKHEAQENFIAECKRLGVPFIDLDKEPVAKIPSDSPKVIAEREKQNFINRLQLLDGMDIMQVRRIFGFGNPLGVAKSINQKAGRTIISVTKRKIDGVRVSYFKYEGRT